MTVDEILQRLDRVKREKAGQWAARCPAHEDNGPSLAVKDSGGKVLLFCHAGCKLDAILQALKLEERDLFAERDDKPANPTPVAQYPYHDEHGELLYEAVRLVPKSFRQRRPDGKGGWIWNLTDVRRVLYRLPELLADTTGRRVFVVEGEKDVDTMRGLGFLATCCAGGSNAWQHVATHAAEVLKGRHVTILPDNDDPGRKYAAAVAASLRPTAASLRVLALPGLGVGGDVSDWVRDGGTAAQLIELVKSAPAPDEPMPELAGIDIGTVAQRLDGERQRRLEDAKKIIPLGVSFLDDALGGLMVTDVMILTAATGAGKTQLAGSIAKLAALSQRRVVGFFLEADRGELERRWKFSELAQAYADGAARRSANREQHRILSFGQWMRGELDDVFGPHEESVERALGRLMGTNLRTVYRGKSFTLDDTERAMLAMQDHADMFVVDHLGYIDGDDKDENRAVTAIMERLRDIVLQLHKPVLIVAHQRKESAASRPTLVPPLREILGTGNVTKIATRVVALAPAPRVKASAWHLAPTYMQVLKDRIDGGSQLVARVVFDKSTGTYRDSYELGIAVREGNTEEWVRIEDRPWWARRAE